MAYSVERLNSKLNNNAKDYIKFVDDKYTKQIKEIADNIHLHRKERPIILLAGPSGSGKTTTALSIEKILDDSGFSTHTLSMDNYFLPVSENEKQLLNKGKLDLESPKRVDVNLLNEQLEKMINCETVEIPKYDFTNSTRIYSGVKLTRKPDELIILEGIHALNPEVITIPDESTARLYVSVRTRVVDDGTVLHPAKIRLLRRMIRDKLFRNRTVQETLYMFRSVEKGSKKYIMPFKSRSTFDVDTFIPYELSAYKPFLYDEVKSIQNEADVDDLLKILSSVTNIDDSLVPKTSLIREFIGNGVFEY